MPVFHSQQVWILIEWSANSTFSKMLSMEYANYFYLRILHIYYLTKYHFWQMQKKIYRLLLNILLLDLMQHSWNFVTIVIEIMLLEDIKTNGMFLKKILWTLKTLNLEKRLFVETLSLKMLLLWPKMKCIHQLEKKR